MEMLIHTVLETVKEIPVTALAFSPSGRYLVAASQDGELIVWNTRNWDMELKFKSREYQFGHIQFVKEWMFFAAGKFGIFEFDLLQNQIKRIAGGYLNRISSNQKILAASQDWDSYQSMPEDELFLIINDYTSGKFIGEYKVGDVGRDIFWLHTLDLLFSPDSSRLAVIIELHQEEMDWEYRLYLLPTDEQSELQSLQEAGELIHTPCFSPDNKYLAYGKQEKCSIEVLRVKEKSKYYCELFGHEDKITALTFNQNSKLMLSGSSDNTLRVWDVEPGKLIKTFYHPFSVSSLVFHPSMANIAMGTDSGEVYIIELVGST